MKYLLLISGAVVMSCNNDSTTGTVKDSTSTATSVRVDADSVVAINPPSCYAHQTSNNLIWLELKAVRPTVSGNLTYDFLGKDKTEGTISGTMRGDTLYADYTFKSQGNQTVQQVAFLRRGNAFVEGSGNTEQTGEAMRLANNDSLPFNGVILKEVPCTRAKN